MVLLNENEYQNALIKIITRIYEFRHKRIAKWYEKQISNIEEEDRRSYELLKYNIDNLREELEIIKNHLMNIYNNVPQMVSPKFHEKFRNLVRLPKDIIEKRSLDRTREECPACYGDKLINLRWYDVGLGEVGVYKCYYCGHEFEISNEK